MSASSGMDTATMERIRGDFPGLERFIYLNTGTYGLMPEPAVETLLHATATLEREGVACGMDFAADAERCRHAIGDMIGGEAADIALTRNATDGINLALAGLDWSDGDQVLTTDEEHEASLHPLLHLQATRGITVTRLPCSDDPQTMLDRLNGAGSRQLRLLVTSHVTCETGTRLPVAEMCAWARNRGVLSLVDAAHTCGVLPVDVRAIGCDFMAGNGHKWLHGPKGTGWFWSSAESRDRLIVRMVGAGSLQAANPATGQADLHPTAQRFEYGSRSWALATGWKASMDYLSGIGYDRIRRHSERLVDELFDALSSMKGARALTPRSPQGRAGLICFTFDGHDATDVCRNLRERYRIHTRLVPARNGVRVSAALYNTSEHIAAFAASVDQHLSGL
ncbi:MAG: aminotransferase class V-fold PLP-dependent enzyme [Chthonomonadales bacterium]|nr:aminotransferase class V-fold PLP-dependent enzyme [Chthonomonadales bacterium]